MAVSVAFCVRKYKCGVVSVKDAGIIMVRPSFRSFIFMRFAYRQVGLLWSSIVGRVSLIYFILTLMRALN